MLCVYDAEQVDPGRRIKESNLADQNQARDESAATDRPITLMPGKWRAGSSTGRGTAADAAPAVNSR